MSQWIKIEDESPKPYEKMLLLVKQFDKLEQTLGFLSLLDPFGEHDTDPPFFFTEGLSKTSFSMSEVLAWQPLPEIPEEFR